MIKFVAFDVDGTLLERDYLPESAIKAIQQLKERGVTVALCTGRSEYEMKSLRERLGIDWSITCNGSHIGYRGETVYGNAFPRETVSRWLSEADRLNHALLLYGSKHMFANRADDPYIRQARQEIGMMEPLMIDRDKEIPEIYQCIVFCDERGEEHYIGQDRSNYYLHRWREWAMDINPNGMNKAMGLRKLLDHLNISPQEAAAFGDGTNDFEMIESVGTGIAMGNAPEQLKQKARFVTKPLREDGIAYAVEKWILNRAM